MAFMLIQGPQTVQHNPETNNKSENTRTPEQRQEFTDIEDNVGAVSFTGDQLTELARNIFSLDGYLNNVKIELSDDGGVAVMATIKDKDKLIDTFPELDKYGALLAAVEKRKLDISGKIVDNGGMAAFEITSASVSGVPVSRELVTPFMENSDFAELFNVKYDSVKIENNRLVFYGQLPDILEY